MTAPVPSRTVASAFDPRANAIGVLRLSFAWMVVVSHAFTLAGHEEAEPLVALTGDQEGLGGLAVVCFFVLSGFLISRSLERSSSVRRYLWHRFLRIMPGFWVCLVVTAFIFAPIAWVAAHGSLAGYLETTPSSFGYVTNNAALLMLQHGIGDTLHSVPVPSLLNGPLWTLATEFGCYLVLVLVGAALLRRGRGSSLALAVVAATYATYVSGFIWPGNALATAGEAIHVYWCLAFALGVAAYCLRDRIPIDDRLALVAFLPLVAAALVHLYRPVAPIPVAYLVIWAAVRLPLGTPRADLSYGTYVYAFPIQQLMVLGGVGHIGVAALLAASVPLVVGAAALSWFLIERPTLSLRSFDPASRQPRAAAVAEVPAARRRSP